jgi:DNA-binding CsgD family transcriptional regulator
MSRVSGGGEAVRIVENRTFREYSASVSATTAAIEIVGRERELDRVLAWSQAVGTDASTLVIRGEAGIGKTTVWDAALDAARAARVLVLATRPVEAELPLGYAGLGDLLLGTIEPMLAELPSPLAQALSSALMLGADDRPAEPLAVGRGVLSALRALSARRPLVVAVDDIQWLDAATARALRFAIRRLRQERAPVSMALSLRDGHVDPLESDQDAGLVGIHLEGLDLELTERLLHTRIDAEIPQRIVKRIHQRSGGNPFYALELAQAASDASAIRAPLLDVVEQRLARAPAAAGPALEVAAVMGAAPLAAFDDAAELDVAVRAGLLVSRDNEVRFAHPLLAEVAYGRLPPGRRRALHEAAARLEPSVEGRARHLALATDGEDAALADLLSQAARSARDRGAVETAAELATHAWRLTPEREDEMRALRLMDRAEYLFLSADEPAAREMVDRVLASVPGGAVRARALFQRSLHEVDPREAVGRLEAAVAEAHDDILLAIRARAQLAWQRGAWLGDVTPAVGEALSAVDLAEDAGDAPTLVTALTTAGLVASLAGEPAGQRYFRRAIAIAERDPAAAGDHTPRLALAHWRWWSGDWTDADALLADERAEADRRGDESLHMRIDVLSTDLALRRGQWDEAERAFSEQLDGARDYWRTLILSRRAILRARRGMPEARGDADEVAASPLAGNDAVFAAAADYARALLDWADGRLRDGLDALVRLPAVSDTAGSRAPEFAATIPEVVEALVEAADLERAKSLTRQLERWAPQLDPWATAALELCRGLVQLGAGDPASAAEALDRARSGFERIGAPWEQGLTGLAQGRALRRMGRRRDAGVTLEHAVAIFEQLRAEPHRLRAADELRRAQPSRRRDGSLTMAERRVAAAVTAGQTNKEVAAGLFTSVRTVEAHLTRIYQKLSIRSRSELTRAVVERRVDLDEPEDVRRERGDG